MAYGLHEVKSDLTKIVAKSNGCYHQLMAILTNHDRVPTETRIAVRQIMQDTTEVRRTAQGLEMEATTWRGE